MQVVMSKATDNKIDIEKLRKIVREEVRSVLQNLTGDPDAGLKIKDEVVEEIKESQKQIEEGKTVSREEVQEKYMNS